MEEQPIILSEKQQKIAELIEKFLIIIFVVVCIRSINNYFYIKNSSKYFGCKYITSFKDKEVEHVVCKTDDGGVYIKQ